MYMGTIKRNTMRKFNAKEVHVELVQWISDWFLQNGPTCNAVIGLSGGKDSTIVAALLVEALGADRVIGVALPQGDQGLNGADRIAEYLGISFMVSNIGPACDAIVNSLPGVASVQTVQNIPARVRMATLYAISQSSNGRVPCNCNLSEDWIGYSTRWGDDAGDFRPISNLTVTELRQLGRELNLPVEWVDKTPDDGLPHSSPDEEKFGFSYETLDKYIRRVEVPSKEIKEKIDSMHAKNLFKVRFPESYNYMDVEDSL